MNNGITNRIRNYENDNTSGVNNYVESSTCPREGCAGYHALAQVEMACMPTFTKSSSKLALRTSFLRTSFSEVKTMGPQYGPFTLQSLPFTLAQTNMEPHFRGTVVFIGPLLGFHVSFQECMRP